MVSKRGKRGGRSKSKGSVFQRGDGRWVAQIALSNGKYKPAYFHSEAEAQTELIRMLVAQQGGLPLPGVKLTVGTFLTRWLDESARPRLQPSTYASYESYCRVHLIPGIGKISLVKLTPLDVQTFINNRQASGLTPRTVQYLRAILRAALAQALKWELVGRNVAVLTDPPRQERHEVAALSPGQALALLAALKADPLYPLYYLALATGLRQGELLGLQGSDLDLDGGVLTVRHALHRVNGTPMLGEPKTHRSRRAVDLSEDAVAVIRSHHAHQLEHRASPRPGVAGHRPCVYDSDGSVPERIERHAPLSAHARKGRTRQERRATHALSRS